MKDDARVKKQEVKYLYLVPGSMIVIVSIARVTQRPPWCDVLPTNRPTGTYSYVLGSCWIRQPCDNDNNEDATSCFIFRSLQPSSAAQVPLLSLPFRT